VKFRGDPVAVIGEPVSSGNARHWADFDETSRKAAREGEKPVTIRKPEDLPNQ